MADPKKFSTGAKFLKPILEEHNAIVDALGGTVQNVAGDGEIASTRFGKNTTISLSNSIPKFRFAQLATTAWRTEDADVAFLAYSEGEWCLTEEYCQVRTTFMKGFLFAGQLVTLLRLPEHGHYEIMGDGIDYCRATTNEAFNESFADTIECTPIGVENPEDINTIDVSGYWADVIDRGIVIGCNWNELELQWEGTIEKCG